MGGSALIRANRPVTITERDVSSMDPGEDTTGADASPKADEIKAMKRGESSDATADNSDMTADDVAANENVVSDDAIATSAATDDNGNDAADDTSNDASDDDLDPTIYGSTVLFVMAFCAIRFEL